MNPCYHCGNPLTVSKGVFVDHTGGDVCGWDGGNEPHEIECPACSGSGITKDPVYGAAPDLLAALEALASTARTFRNVPKDEQEWTSIDDTALEQAFAAIAKAKGEA